MDEAGSTPTPCHPWVLWRGTHTPHPLLMQLWAPDSFLGETRCLLVNALPGSLSPSPWHNQDLRRS